MNFAQNTYPSKLTVISVAAAGALALASCAPNDGAPEGPEQPEGTQDTGAEATDEATEPDTADTADEETAVGEPTEEETTEDTGADAGGDHPVYQAVETVLAEYPDGVITEFEDEGSYQEIFVYDGETEWELEVDSESFEIIDTEDDGIDDDDREKAETVEIEFADALQTAESEASAEPYQAELDTEGGVVVWEIELDNGTEVYVDVTNGEVVRVDTDS